MRYDLNSNTTNSAALIDRVCRLGSPGQFGVVPMGANGPLLPSLFGAAHSTADYFAMPESAVATGLVVVDFRIPGRAEPWPIYRFARSTQRDTELFYEDLTYLQAVKSPPTDQEAVMGYLAIAANRLSEWLRWHHDKAEERGLADGGMDALENAIGFARVFEGTAARPKGMFRAAADRVLEEVRAAIDSADAEAAGEHETHAGDHAHELDQGFIRALGRLVARIADLAEQAAAGAITWAAARIAACEALASAPAALAGRA